MMYLDLLKSAVENGYVKSIPFWSRFDVQQNGTIRARETQHDMWRLPPSSFRHKVDENCLLQGCYVGRSDNSSQTFRDKLSFPSSKAKHPKPIFSTLDLDPTGCSETSVRNCHYTLRNSPEERNSRDIPLLFTLSTCSKVFTFVRDTRCFHETGIYSQLYLLCFSFNVRITRIYIIFLQRYLPEHLQRFRYCCKSYLAS